MKTMEQVANEMTFEEKAEVMNDFNTLNKNGCIGDCTPTSLPRQKVLPWTCQCSHML